MAIFGNTANGVNQIANLENVVCYCGFTTGSSPGTGISITAWIDSDAKDHAVKAALYKSDRTPVTNGTSTSTDFSGVNGWVTVTFASDPVLVKGDVFWVVFTQSDASATDIGISTTDIYPDWGYKEYTGTWGSLQDNDLAFYIETTDDTTVIQVELTDGTNTHILEGNIAFGTGSFSINAEEPISAEVSYVAQDISFSG